MLKCGTVLGYEGSKAVIMTENCSYIYLDIRQDMYVGQEIWFQEPQALHLPAKRARYLAIAAGRVAAVFLIALLAFRIAFPAPTPYAYVDVDINPSTEFVIDKNDIVMKTLPLNEDARTLLKEMKLDGMAVDRAIVKLVEQSQEKGYMKQETGNSVLLSIAVNSKAVKDLDQRSEEEKRLLDYMKGLERLAQKEQFQSSILKVSPETKKEADKNGISMGRQEAIGIARQSGRDITAEQIRDYTVKEVVKLIGEEKIVMSDEPQAPGKPETSATASPSPVPAPSPSSLPSPSPGPSPSSSPSPSPEPTQEPTPAPAPKPTPEPEKKLESGAVRVSGNVGKSGIVLKWNAVEDEQLRGYKVVISKHDSTPKYPENGYLYFITDKDRTSAVIDNKTAYNNGDFGEYLTGNQAYYFSITALYEDKAVPGNVIRLKFPNVKEDTTDSADSDSSLNVRASVADGGVRIRWNPLEGGNFSYYKIVISHDNARPKYPEDGYMTYITDINASSCFVNPEDGYNGGDFGGKLVPGETYYFSITAVFSQRKIVGNAVKLTVP